MLCKSGVSCFYKSEMLNSNFVQLIKFSAENPRLRKAAKRFRSFLKTDNKTMKSNNFIYLNGNENFDGIIEKIVIENDLKRVTISVKQWHSDTYVLSELNFIGVVFQSLPDISSFNLITEIITRNDKESIINELDNYLRENPTLILANAHDNIRNDIKKETNLSSYFITSGYCKDWLIVCAEMLLTEKTELEK